MQRVAMDDERRAMAEKTRELSEARAAALTSRLAEELAVQTAEERALAAAEAARESSAADAALRQRELEERLRELLAEQRKSFEHEIAEMQRTEQARLGAEVRS